MNWHKVASRKWFYPLIYFLLILISFWPPYTQKPYDPRNTSDVILSILKISIQPYAAWGWLLHVATLGIVILAIFKPDNTGRLMAAYFGINYLVIAIIQNRTVTENYGLAINIGALIAEVLLGVIWLWVAWKDRLQISFRRVPDWRWMLIPLALLVFWSPLAVEGTKVIPNFDPLLLLTSPDYGLTYCFMTPVFLTLLILSYAKVDGFVIRVTAFNALIYGILNLTHWFNPDLVWMGVMHLPLLITSLIALFLPQLTQKPNLQLA